MNNVARALTGWCIAVVAAAFEEWVQIDAVGVRVGRAIVRSSDAFVDVDTRTSVLERERKEGVR